MPSLLNVKFVEVLLLRRSKIMSFAVLKHDRPYRTPEIKRYYWNKTHSQQLLISWLKTSSVSWPVVELHFQNNSVCVTVAVLQYPILFTPQGLLSVSHLISLIKRGNLCLPRSVTTEHALQNGKLLWVKLQEPADEDAGRLDNCIAAPEKFTGWCVIRFLKLLSTSVMVKAM